MGPRESMMGGPREGERGRERGGGREGERGGERGRASIAHIHILSLSVFCFYSPIISILIFSSLCTHPTLKSPLNFLPLSLFRRFSIFYSVKSMWTLLPRETV